jgi:hypothetical protein
MTYFLCLSKGNVPLGKGPKIVQKPTPKAESTLEKKILNATIRDGRSRRTQSNSRQPD